MGIVDRLHKANGEEEATVTVLNTYIANQEEANGPLVKRVQIVDPRNNIFKALEIEAEDIKAHRNIIAYEKQAKKTVPSKLTRDK